jgi:hypothetical protein
VLPLATAAEFSTASARLRLSCCIIREGNTRGAISSEISEHGEPIRLSGVVDGTLGSAIVMVFFLVI